MKIESLSCSRVEIALHETFRTAIRETDSISALRVVLQAGGRVGVGYATATPAITGDTVESIEALISDLVGPYLVGRDLAEPKPYVLGAQSSSLFGIPDAEYEEWTRQCSSGMAGVDLALHDVMFGSPDPVNGSASGSVNGSVNGSVSGPVGGSATGPVGGAGGSAVRSSSPASPRSGPPAIKSPRSGLPVGKGLTYGTRSEAEMGPVSMRSHHEVPLPDRRSGSLVTSVTIGAGSLEDMVATAHRRVAAGFRVIKAKLGADPARDAQRLIALAQALGAIRTNDPHDGASSAVQFWVDANQGWTVAQALDIFDAALDANVVLGVFEQPTSAADIDGLREVRIGVQQRCAARGVVAVPVVADESARTLADIDRIIEADAADAINVKFMKFGGVTGSGVAVAKARAAGLGVLVGSMMEHPHSVAAAVRFASLLGSLPTISVPAKHGPAITIPSFSVHDLDAAWWAKDTSPLVYADGLVSVT